MSAIQKRWDYAAVDGEGKIRQGQVPARTLQEAREWLRGERLEPLELKVRRAHPSVSRDNARTSLPLADVVRITSKLRDMLAAELPLGSALQILMGQCRSKAERAFLEDILPAVRGGASLSEALAGSRYRLPAEFIPMISAGERIGALKEQFCVLADHYESVRALRRDLMAELLYPAALLVLMVFTIGFLSFVIIPQFESIFASSNALPPPETRLVISGADFIRSNWWAVLITGTAAALALRYLAGRHPALVNRFMDTLPFVGALSCRAKTARYFRTLSALLLGGAPLSSALSLARATISDGSLRRSFDAAEAEVRAGEPIGTAMARHAEISSDVISYLRIGEETGQLGKMSGHAAIHLETDFRRAVKQLMTILSPALTAMMGLLTAGVIGAIMIGVLSLNDALY